MVDPLLMSLRVLARRIHLIATLGAGLWLALSGLTGSLLVFGDQLDELFHPELYRIAQPAERASMDVVLQNVSEAGGEVMWARLSGSESPVHEVWVDCDRCQRVWVDPSTGLVNGVRSYDGTTRLWLHELHRRMLLGDAGERAVGWAGLFLVGILLSGIALWLPRKRQRAFRLLLSKGWKVATHDLHRMGGLVVAPLLLLSALSGIYFVFHDEIDSVLNRWTDPGAVEASRPALAPGISPDGMIRESERLFRSAEATWFTPASQNRAATVRLRQSFESHPNGRTFVAIDPASGNITGLIDPARASVVSMLINELYPLHIGRSGGIAHRLLLVLIGLTPSMLLVTGLVMWWNRSLRRSWRREIACKNVTSSSGDLQAFERG
ncbi:MAG: PepSY-associated TM helix domain-containing protein [Thermoanaerobaculia bacterium]|nr:PepSY-associated TM helix domain-containing protein [Thermoanaerobaculia bacterium]